MTHAEQVDVVIVGGGPAGAGLLVCAAQHGELDALLSQRVLVIEAGASLGAGELRGYAIDSDTLSDALLECLDSPGAALFAPLRARTETAAVGAYAGRNLPLRTLANYLDALGETTAAWLRAAPRAELALQSRATTIHLEANRLRVELDGATGARSVSARSVLLALGGAPDADAFLRSDVGGAGPLGCCAHAAAIASADAILRGDGAALARVREATRDRPFVIVGGSHSAFTIAGLALAAHGDAIAEGTIVVLARRRPNLFFASTAEARDGGYAAFGARDICPATGRVFRLSGLRFGCRELAARVLGVGSAPSEPRVRFVECASVEPAAIARVLRDATVVVPAFGYRPRLLPVLRAGRSVRLAASEWRRPHVDDACRVLDADGAPLPGLFAMGLGSGFVPSGPLGGEPSFRGQTNGLWLYQNGVGRIALDGMRAVLRTGVAA